MAGSDLFTGTLDLLILKALTWGPSHGYAIGRWIRETTGDVLVVHVAAGVRDDIGQAEGFLHATARARATAPEYCSQRLRSARRCARPLGVRV